MEEILILHSIIWRTRKFTCTYYIFHEVFANYFNYFQFIQLIYNAVSMAMVLFVQINLFSSLPHLQLSQEK